MNIFVCHSKYVSVCVRAAARIQEVRGAAPPHLTLSNKCINFSTSLHNLLIISTFSVQIFSHWECPLSLCHNSRLMADSLIVAQPLSQVCVCMCLCQCLFSFVTIYVCVCALMSALRVWVMAMESYGPAILLSWHLLHSSGLSGCRASHHIEIRALLDLVSNILTCLFACCGLFKHRAVRREEGGVAPAS